jgi:hypothetical protein
MSRVFFLPFLLLCFCSSQAASFVEKSNVKLSVVSVLSTDRSHGTSMGMGLGLYGDNFELGLTGSGYVEDSATAHDIVTAVVYGGARKKIEKNVYFASGVTFLQNFGDEDGLPINREYEIGPYVSLEIMISQKVLIGGWILPYQYDYEKVNGVARKEHEYFSSGGITLNYYFTS